MCNGQLRIVRYYMQLLDTMAFFRLPLDALRVRQTYNISANSSIISVYGFCRVMRFVVRLFISRLTVYASVRTRLESTIGAKHVDTYDPCSSYRGVLRAAVVSCVGVSAGRGIVHPLITAWSTYSRRYDQQPKFTAPAWGPWLDDVIALEEWWRVLRRLQY